MISKMFPNPLSDWRTLALEIRQPELIEWQLWESIASMTTEELQVNWKFCFSQTWNRWWQVRTTITSDGFQQAHHENWQGLWVVMESTSYFLILIPGNNPPKLTTCKSYSRAGFNKSTNQECAKHDVQSDGNHSHSHNFQSAPKPKLITIFFPWTLTVEIAKTVNYGFTMHKLLQNTCKISGFLYIGGKRYHSIFMHSANKWKE